MNSEYQTPQSRPSTIVSSSDNICKQFGPRSGSKVFDTLVVFLKHFFFEKNDHEKRADGKKREQLELCL